MAYKISSYQFCVIYLHGKWANDDDDDADDDGDGDDDDGNDGDGDNGDQFWLYHSYILTFIMKR